MKRFLLIVAAISAASLFPLAADVVAQCGGMHGGGHEDHAAAKAASEKVAVYPIDYCIVSGEKLGEMGDPVKYEHKGRTLYFCCKGCVKKFKAAPEKYLKELDAAILATAAKTKPDSTTGSAAAVSSTNAAGTAVKSDTMPKALDWCVVSGETLGEMGDPVKYTYKDRTIQFCCKGCIGKFEKDPARYVARADSALTGLIVQPGTEKQPESQEHGASHVH